MTIPNDPKTEALAAHRDRIGWTDFLKNHAPKIRKAEPTDAVRHGTDGDRIGIASAIATADQCEPGR